MGQRLDRTQTPVSSLFKYDSSSTAAAAASSNGAGSSSNTNQNSSSTATTQLNSNTGGGGASGGGASGGGGGGASSSSNHRSSSNRHHHHHHITRATSNDFIQTNYNENTNARPNDAFLRFLQYRGRHQTNSSSNSDEDDSQTYNPFEHAIPILMGFRDLKCLVCHKMIPSDEIETHIAMCLTKPRVTYNDDVLGEDKEEECIICFENLEKGQTIARLPCLCIYHKHCIDSWFKKNQSCPAHPFD